MLVYADVWAWDDGCHKANKTNFVQFVRGSYNCMGELYDNAVPYDGGSDKVVEIMDRVRTQSLIDDLNINGLKRRPINE